MAQSPYRQPASSKPKPLGNHQASWIWGRHLVLETLQARQWPILELLLADDLPAPELAEVTRLAAESEVSIERAARNSLVSRCRGEDHQGYAARMAEFPYATTAALLSRPSPWPLMKPLPTRRTSNTTKRGAPGCTACSGLILSWEILRNSSQ